MNFHVEWDTEEADTQNETIVDAATVRLGREGKENRPDRVAAHCTASMAALSLTIVMLHEQRAKQSWR